MSLPNPSDTQGILQKCFDPSNNALRISSASDLIYIPANSLAAAAGTPTIVVTNDWPRAQFADGVTTTMVGTFSPPPTWSRMSMGFWFTSTVGSNAQRWRLAMKEARAFQDNMADAYEQDVTATQTIFTANVVHKGSDQILNYTLIPGGLGGSHYQFLISRIGADGADTNTGIGELFGVYAAKA